jgi:hypothetical protein
LLGEVAEILDRESANQGPKESVAMYAIHIRIRISYASKKGVKGQ